MPLISPFGHIIKGQGRHLCSQDKLLNGMIKREKIKKATCKREAHGAEEVSLQFLSCHLKAMWQNQWKHPQLHGWNWALLASHRWCAYVCDSSMGLPAWESWKRIGWFGSLVCFQHPSVPGIHLPQVDQGASMTKTFPTRQSSEITPVINLFHFNYDRKTLKI